MKENVSKYIIAFFDNVNFNTSMLQIFYLENLKPLALFLLGENVICLSFNHKIILYGCDSKFYGTINRTNVVKHHS